MRLRELPQAITFPIGTTGAQVVITHAATDSRSLGRASVMIRRGELLLTQGVVRLNRRADRRGLIQAALCSDSDHPAGPPSRSGTQVAGGNGSVAVGDFAVADAPALLTETALENALLEAAEAVKAIGSPFEGDSGAENSRDAMPQGCEGGGKGALSIISRPQIVVRSELAAVAAEAERALYTSPGIKLYTRARMLVRVVRDVHVEVSGIARPPGAPVIEPVSRAFLREKLDNAASWVITGRGAQGHVPALPPKWVVETLLARSEWQFPRIEGITEAPTFRPDGTILQEPGYDGGTGFLYEPNATFPVVQGSPSLADAQVAAEAVLKAFDEFPFVAGSDRTAALACVLTLVGRTAIDGPTPLFAVRATAPGTGKGLLAKVSALIGSGRLPTLLAVTREEDEVRKRLLTIGLEGTRCVLLDNVEGGLGSPCLAAALTTPEISDRVLGGNRLATVPMTAVFLATGNNISFRGDLARRVVPIDLDSKLEFPEDREFARPDLIGWVRMERPRLVVATLTILRAFHLAGRPSHGRARLGSFEAWDDIVRAPLLWLGHEDPCCGRQRVRDEGDSDLETLREVLEAWWCEFQETASTLADAIGKAFGNPPMDRLATALAGLDPRTSGSRPSTRSVGDRFKHWKGRLASGFILETETKKDHGAVLWRVRRVAA